MGRQNRGEGTAGRIGTFGDEVSVTFLYGAAGKHPARTAVLHWLTGL